jgi:hypothetical protein
MPRQFSGHIFMVYIELNTVEVQRNNRGLCINYFGLVG